MPDKGSPLKCVYTLRMPRDLRAKCQRLADAAGLDLSAWICRTIEMEVRDAERANAYR
jgi:predicted HicB family RNase H-like nuclease